MFNLFYPHCRELSRSGDSPPPAYRLAWCAPQHVPGRLLAAEWMHSAPAIGQSPHQNSCLGIGRGWWRYLHAPDTPWLKGWHMFFGGGAYGFRNMQGASLWGLGHHPKSWLRMWEHTCCRPLGKAKRCLLCLAKASWVQPPYQLGERLGLGCGPLFQCQNNVL